MPPKDTRRQKRRRREANKPAPSQPDTETPRSDDENLVISRALLSKVIGARVEEVKAKYAPRAELADALEEVLAQTVAQLDRTEADLAEAYREIEQLKGRR